ncbi:nuclease-related domain-containing protein [Macrococcoides caseolyticum]|uniref:nuclease-related domain-containing protein n=1 Tax=Macrococcoides caseolyticum TaxID=69966 RepID=UPI001F165EF9|nr:nuclease-related domain-containing protein [Macrococcus caseolyticus]MCE4957978.1 NERD domain-containing protein [Macrococcus caseolyticus]
MSGLDGNTLLYGLIGLGVLALIFFVLWMLSLSSKKKAIARQEEAFRKEQKEKADRYHEESEKSRLSYKKELTEQKETLQKEIDEKALQIESLKMFSKDKGEYLTDLTLIQIKEQFIHDERIRPEDMHVLANIYIPGKRVKSTDKLDHVVLTRTGIYLIDSNYWTGHIYHGVSEMQFDGEPMLEGVFNLLGLDPHSEQTIVLDKNKEGNAEFRSYHHTLETLKLKAERLEKVFELPYPVTPIAYYNAEGVGSEHFTNYSRDNSVKVIVGEEELQMFFEKFVFHGRFQYKVEELENIMDRIEHLNP